MRRGIRNVVLRLLDGETHLGRDHRLQEVFVVTRKRGVELVFGRDLQMAVQLVALDGGVLHLVVDHLVIEVGVGVLRLFAHAGAPLHHCPEHHQADEDKEPKHDGFNARVHQRLLFAAKAKQLPRPPMINPWPKATFLDAPAPGKVAKTTQRPQETRKPSPPEKQ